MQSVYCPRCYTYCGAKSFVYDWIINNFDTQSHKNRFESPIFSTSNENDARWQIILYTKGLVDLEYGYTKEYVKIGLQLIDCNDANAKVSCTFSIMKSDGTEYYQSLITRDFNKGTEIIDKILLQYNLNYDKYLINGKLHIKYEIIRCSYDKKYKYYNKNISNLKRGAKLQFAKKSKR